MGKKNFPKYKKFPQFPKEVYTLSRAAQKGFSKLFGSVEAVQWRKLLAMKRDVCCLMVGFLLSMTAKTSSLMFCSVVFRKENMVSELFSIVRIIKILH